MVDTFDALADDPDAGDAGLRVSMVVITAADAWWRKRDVDRAWRSSHQAMAAGTQRRLVVADGSDHDVPQKRPDTIVDAVVSLTRR